MDPWQRPTCILAAHAPRSSRRGAALALLAGVALLFPDTAIAQAPSTQSPAAQSPSAQSPQSPAPMIPPAPAAAPVRPVPPPGAAIPPGQASPAVAPGPPHVSLDAVLYALKGHEAILFVGDRRISGLIIGVDGGFVMMVDEDQEGRIAMIPKEQITDVRGRVASQRRVGASREPLPPDGVGLLAGGGIMVALGGPLFISGVVFVALAPDFTVLWAPQLLPAVGLLGGGVPLLVSGVRRRRAYQQAVFGGRLGRLSPAVGRTAGGGWTGGLTLRF